jgi:hypothetical protein
MPTMMQGKMIENHVLLKNLNFVMLRERAVDIGLKLVLHDRAVTTKRTT